LVAQTAALDPVDLTQATALMNTGFQNAPTNQMALKMSNTVNRAISSQSQGQVNDILANLLDTFALERDDFIKIEQGKAIAMNEKAAFDTALPGRAADIEAKAIKGGPRKIKTAELPSRERLDDFAYIESPEISTKEIDAKINIKSLQDWLKLKILGKEFPNVKGGTSKMRREDLLGLVDDYKTNQLQFSDEAIAHFSPAKIAAKDVSPVKSTRAKDKSKVAVIPMMSDDDFKTLDFEKKIAVFKAMIKSSIPQRTLSEEDFDTLIAMMGNEDPDDDGKFNDFYEHISKEKETKGFGLAKMAGKKIAFGCGFAKPSMKIEAANIDFDSGIKRETTYIPLGRYFVNRHKLGENRLMIKTIKGGAISGLPTLTISPKLSKMIHKIVTGKGFPSHNELGELGDDDKDILYKIFKLSQAQGIDSIPAPSKSRDDQELNRFTILRGEIVAGNDSKELVKEFKVLLLKMMGENKIAKHAGREILMDLVSLGY
jgi:hypothetical protein